MSIQQAFNNILMSAQIGAGLYAHSPAGQTTAEIRKVKKAIKAENIKADIETEIHEDADDGFLEKTYASRTQNIANLKQRLFELNPTEKGYQNYLKAIKEKQFAQEAYNQRKELLKSRGGKK